MQTVAQVMTRNVITVTPETPINEVARLLAEHSVSGPPVVDAANVVVGVVSEGDILVREAGSPTASRRPLARLFGPGRQVREQQAKVDAHTAGELMTSPALVIDEFRAIRAVAEIMTEHKVNRLPVVDADGKLLGIVTRADLVRAFVLTDADLAEAIRREVLILTMWLDPDKFEVVVDHGVAHVHGAVQKRSTAEMTARFVTMFPGVVSAETDITWTEDDGDGTVPLMIK